VEVLTVGRGYRPNLDDGDSLASVLRWEEREHERERWRTAAMDSESMLLGTMEGFPTVSVGTAFDPGEGWKVTTETVQLGKVNLPSGREYEIVAYKLGGNWPGTEEPTTFAVHRLKNGGVVEAVGFFSEADCWEFLCGDAGKVREYGVFDQNGKESKVQRASLGIPYRFVERDVYDIGAKFAKPAPIAPVRKVVPLAMVEPSDLTRAELIEYATALGIDGPSGYPNRAELEADVKRVRDRQTEPSVGATGKDDLSDFDDDPPNGQGEPGWAGTGDPNEPSKEWSRSNLNTFAASIGIANAEAYPTKTDLMAEIDSVRGRSAAT
jgi:hypothetical protein